MSYLDDISIILSSKEFRRMQDKTQLFYSNKGDHYRTRLTHTLEVYSIALEIARHIAKKNEKQCKQAQNESGKSNTIPKFVSDDRLIAAIALGHDVGHTPFGHVGERVLSAILEGKDNLGGLIVDDTFDNHCFKHNINSYRILNQFKTPDGVVRLSWQVLDGVLKHTEVCKDPSKCLHLSSANQNDPYLLQKNLLSGKLKTMADEVAPNSPYTYQTKFEYNKYNVALTLEGQIVAIADEIAQRVSDFDDAARAGYWVTITNSFAKLQGTAFYNANQQAIDDIKSSKENKSVQGLCENLRRYLIRSVEYNYQKDIVISLSKGSTIHTEKCIDFNTNGKKVDEIFNEINRIYIIKCEELRKCDGISTHIIRQIFKAYYNDFSQLGDSCLETICNDVYKKINATLKIQNSKNIKTKEREIKFSSALSNPISNDLSIDGRIDFLKNLKKISNKIKFSPTNKEAGSPTSMIDLFLMEVSYDRENLQKELSLKEEEANIQCWRRRALIKELHSIILHDIALYIAGMTDSFAYEEYHRLYGIRNV